MLRHDAKQSKPLEAEAQTPLPKWILTVLALCLFCDSISTTQLFPFVGFMVADFFGFDTEEERTQVGYYAGFIASSFSIAQFLSNVVWGRISDRIGRKPVILFGLLSTTVCSVLFGMSKSFVWAVSIRALQGLLNGNIGVVKTTLGELTDRTNQARGFSIISVTSGAGRIVGPFLGGLLAQPATKYPDVFGPDSLFATYPYLLPTMTTSAIALFGFVIGLVCLVETKRSKSELRKRASSRLLVRERSINALLAQKSQPPSLWATVSPREQPQSADLMLPLLQSEHSEGNIIGNELGPMDERKDAQVEEWIQCGSNRSLFDFQAQHAFYAASMPANVSGSQQASALVSHHVSMIPSAISLPPSRILSGPAASEPSSGASSPLEEVSISSDSETVLSTDPLGVDSSIDSSITLDDDQLAALQHADDAPPAVEASVWQLLHFRNVLVSCSLQGLVALIFIMIDESYPLLFMTNPEDGGLDFDSSQIGIAQGVGGASLILFQLLLWPRLEKTYGALRTFRIGMSSTFPVLLCLPLLSLVHSIRPLVWALLLTSISIRHSWAAMSFTSSYLLINNSATDSASLGTVNGMGQSAASLARAIGPIVASSVLAWSLNNNLPFPLDYHLLYICLALLSAFSLTVSFSYHEHQNIDWLAEAPPVDRGTVEKPLIVPPAPFSRADSQRSQAAA